MSKFWRKSWKIWTMVQYKNNRNNKNRKFCRDWLGTSYEPFYTKIEEEEIIVHFFEKSAHSVKSTHWKLVNTRPIWTDFLPKFPGSGPKWLKRRQIIILDNLHYGPILTKMSTKKKLFCLNYFLVNFNKFTSEGKCWTMP